MIFTSVLSSTVVLAFAEMLPEIITPLVELLSAAFLKLLQSLTSWKPVVSILFLPLESVRLPAIVASILIKELLPAPLVFKLLVVTALV